MNKFLKIWTILFVILTGFYLVIVFLAIFSFVPETLVIDISPFIVAAEIVLLGGPLVYNVWRSDTE